MEKLLLHFSVYWILPQEDVHHKDYEYTSVFVSFPGLPAILFLTANSKMETEGLGVRVCTYLPTYLNEV